MKEIFWINAYNSIHPAGYNLSGGGQFKKEITKDTRKKLSYANMGKKCSEKTKQKLREMFTGRNLGDSTKEKMTKSRRKMPPKSNNSTGYKGVVKYKYGYYGNIKINGIDYCIGCSRDIEYVAAARDLANIIVFGDDIYRNFPHLTKEQLLYKLGGKINKNLKKIIIGEINERT